MAWTLRIAKRAEKELRIIPAKDRKRIATALAAMQLDPFGGDIVRLENQSASWRRRVGNYRISFDLDPDQALVDILRIARRTTTTY
ncbi:MAG: type II toxin-antitoxin system RelE/ParE family toxin [Acidobacteria bacterium]|nr:type II toxin-antitoxin system RelE/ParE family toxin [Acidobacteriota bacterium]